MSVPRPAVDERTWYQDAIIYEVRPRSFFDGNDDGIGDLPGLTSKLGYLQDLGITALWLLPFYPSPGRDDGYDIADYTGVDPSVGTLADFEQLVNEAHRRGIRVITELVLNHTSDQHPWFQRARRAPPGSVERAHYVWSDAPDGYAGARIIFRDFEASNWSWDPMAKAYYWHRFFSHQPDLNFECHAVREALLGAVDFWLERGVDGLRLDAVPYLYEEEGTLCENLPRTHAFLKSLRAHVDARFPNRMLLAEANQWPEDVVAYFGHGDECHMNFHFPLMPRLFMALDQEDRFPVVDIFAQTPPIPPTCQWALFLRNHDELTLETVSDEERDAMYRAYAQQMTMRLNLGIRRRLAPLVGNSRRKIELLTGLLLSLPGTPVLYYGDEIGMGDNVYLGDRNGVRTPMQWSSDRNAGFSRANPQRLVLPVVIDPEYAYQAVNVENQQQNPSSLLWWTKRLIALRREHLELGRGSFEMLSPPNPHVFAFLRRLGEAVMLVVANLSRFMQSTELDLARVDGWTPVELFGKERLPSIGPGPYRMTLGPHDFMWLALEPPHEVSPTPSARLPLLECSSLAAALTGAERRRMTEIFGSYLDARAAFAAGGRLRRGLSWDAVPLEGGRLHFVRVDVDYAEGAPATYALLLRFDPGETPLPANAVAAVHQSGVDDPSSRGALVEVLEDPVEAGAFIRLITRQETVAIDGITLSGWSTGQPAAPLATASVAISPVALGHNRDHATLRVGDQFVLKVARRLQVGPLPDVEAGRRLAGDGREVLPRLRGGLDLGQADGTTTTVAVLHSYVPHVTTAWDLARDELTRSLERILAQGSAGPPSPPSRRVPVNGALPESPQVAELLGAFLETAGRLGTRAAEMHLALLSAHDLYFEAEPTNRADLRSRYQSLRTLVGKVWRRLRARRSALRGPAHELAAALVGREADLVASFEPLLQVPPSGLRLRTHGSLQLRHILFTGKDLVVADAIDFSPQSPFERRRKHTPLRDLAWTVCSLQQVALQVVLEPGALRETDRTVARPWADAWWWWSGAALLRAYVATPGVAELLPASDSRQVVFDALHTQRVLEEALIALDTDPAHLVGALELLASCLPPLPSLPTR